MPALEGLERKALPVLELKMLDNEAGVFEGWAAAYGDPMGAGDSYGDVIVPGAFAATLTELRAKGQKVPILWQHDSDEVIGVCDPEDMREDDRGLYVKGQLVLEVARARETRALMAAGALGGLSIGYSATLVEQPPKGSLAWRILKAIALWEFSAVTFPANPDAKIAGVKALDPFLSHLGRLAGEVKAGKVLSAANENRIRQAKGLIDEVLAQLPPTEEEDPKGAPPAPDQAKLAEILGRMHAAMKPQEA